MLVDIIFRNRDHIGCGLNGKDGFGNGKEVLQVEFIRLLLDNIFFLLSDKVNCSCRFVPEFYNLGLLENGSVFLFIVFGSATPAPGIVFRIPPV